MSEPLRYTTVLFDLDHTLLDSDASEQAAFAATMQSIDVEATTEVFAVYHGINQALWRRVEAGEVSPNDVKFRRFEQLLSELGVVGDPHEMGATFVQGLADNGDLYDGARSLLGSLSGRVRMGLVTNGIGAVQRGRIARLDLGGYFEVIAISGELHMSKPDPAIFDHVLSEMEVTDRSGVVMVGDNLASDIAGAVNAGIDSIWFDRHDSAASAVPTYAASTLAEVGSLLS